MAKLTHKNPLICDLEDKLGKISKIRGKDENNEREVITMETH